MRLGGPAQRFSVVTEALGWLGTPYVHGACMKGVGTDCARFLLGVYANAGLIGPFDIPHFPANWHLHSDDEIYLRGLVQHAREIPGPPLPGDIAAFRVKRAYAHAGIVVEWPGKIIHCLQRGGVQWGDAARDALLIMDQREHPPKFFSLFAPEPPAAVADSGAGPE